MQISRTALDLFCGAGGAAVGLKRAGFDHITGIDINNQPEYPFSFSKMDVFDKQIGIGKYDFVWASPPCQKYSWSTIKWRNQGKEYPDLIGKTREMLLKAQVPFVIENVPGAPIRKDLMLCGEMFNLRIIRHRYFECHGFKPRQPCHKKHKRAVWNGTAIGVWTGGRPGCFGDAEKRKYYCTVAGHDGDGGKGNCTLKSWQDAMELPHITSKKMLAEAVPPAYSEYIGKRVFKEWR